LAGTHPGGPGNPRQNQQEKYIFTNYWGPLWAGYPAGNLQDILTWIIMIGTIREYRLSFILFAILFLAGLLLVAAVPRMELHVLLNSHHTPSLDTLFSLLTSLGNGWFAVIFSLFFLFIRFRYSFMLILSYSVSGLLVQLLKRVVFPDVRRPVEYLDQMPGLEMVPGIDLHHTLGFPSGHATTAFAVLLLTGFITGNKHAAFGLMLIAWLVGMSRVYLSQHFLADVLGGSLIGIFSALFFYWYFRRFRSAWIDRSLTAVFRRTIYK
jgi:membrane-associated phospholipid phosphatase